MAAGGEKQTIGKRHGVGQPRGERMRLEMIDRHQRLAGDQRNRLGGGQADDHTADQAGAGRGGHAVELVEADAGFGHGLADNVIQRLDMRARGDFRHHPAEGRVLVGLRQHDIGQNLAAPVGSRSTTAAAVSSHVVSIPSTTIRHTGLRSIARWNGAIVKTNGQLRIGTRGSPLA